ncbi:MAG: hypothetical protein ABIR54_14060 [Burkholderiaceae bacterium]
MKLSRALSKAIGKLLIGVLLFAQIAVASHACPGPSGRGSASQGNSEMHMPSDAGPTGAAAESRKMASGCDQVDQSVSNLCTEHCRQGQQSADVTPAPVVHAAIPTLLYVIPTELELTLGSGRLSTAPDASMAAAPPPPHAILHCVFRI